MRTLKRLKNACDFVALQERLSVALLKVRPQRMLVCCGTGCCSAGALQLAAVLEGEIKKQNLNIELVRTGCHGWCEKGPLLYIQPHNLFYQKVNEADVPQILDLTISRNRPIDRFLYRHDNRLISRQEEIPFYQKQMRLILQNCGRRNPSSIEEYIAWGGYGAFVKVLRECILPEEIIETIKASGLRGRGGAGFPTGRKWESCRAQPGKEKYLICNGDEGDPGAFMDRSVLEGDPHSVIEGMIIAAYAIGDIGKGYIYVREEYPLAVTNLGLALYQAKELGLLGDNILDCGLSLNMEIRRGAGAFVCGESTAMMYSIEGKRGMPRQTPPRSVELGLWEKPTVLNNVKTYASVPLIIARGAQSFASIGTENSKGTHVFALTGKVKNTGLIELPMGTTIREIVFDIGEGIAQDKKFKAVQIGGPSGGCIPERLLDTPIDFDSLTDAGAMMGSGGLVVMDENDCMVEIARFFLSFTQQESCGKCPPCRIGTFQMLQILERICKGEGKEGDIEFLEEVGRKIKETSLCGLGQSAPNPVLTTIRYFRDEYEAHIKDKYCPAKKCKALGTYRIINEACILCGLCEEVCSEQAKNDGRNTAIESEKDRYYVKESKCSHCGICLDVCPVGCILYRGKPVKPVAGDNE
ncbi:MAG: 4Fe-4S binding protein [Gammaproteobacteria bacterium]|nr:4Fe-4S binding protein [Gammaproteobacteria bacterium]